MSLIPVEPEQAARIPDRPVLRDDPKFASGRIAFFQYLIVAVFLFLISGFWEIQVRNPEFYNERAERNRIKSLPVVAPRGKILDRDGRVIVDSHSTFRLILSREHLREEHIPPIADGLHLDYPELAQRIRRFARTRARYETIVIKEELTPQELAFVEAHRDPDFFPEMELIHAQRRLYPRHQLAAHLLGYTGEVSEAELDSPEFARYDQGDIVGKAGIERQYNDILRGVDGQRRVIVDNRGNVRESLTMKEAVAGRNLQLTIDLDLQVVAELAMENRRGAVVALDPRNGEVLAMVSRPAFDPNHFAVRIPSDEWKKLVNDPETPLLNRAIQGQLAPGSTFKPIMVLAGLETSSLDEHWSVTCRGGATFYGHFHKCHLKGGHGVVSLKRGMAQSCDVYFYNVGNRMGIENIARYAEIAGLGRKTGIDLPQEKEGLVPSAEWKIRTFRQKWYPGETISVSIGQGALIVTPLQLAYAIGGIAMGGVWHRPHVVHDPKIEPPGVEPLSPDNVRKVVDGLCAVVNEGGTGTRARLPGVEVCGKTGTAQLASNEFLKSNKSGQAMKDNAWFVGFTPRENPEIIVVALYEGGEHGHLAAPIVRDVIKAFLDKKARNQSKGTAPHPAPPAPEPPRSITRLQSPAHSSP